MPTIDGVILVSNRELNRWVTEAIKFEVQVRTMPRDTWPPEDWPYYTHGSGADRMNHYIDLHCDLWCFYSANRQNLQALAMDQYRAMQRFLFDQPKAQQT